MSDTQKQGGNAQTLWADLAELRFQVLEQSNGLATVIRFELCNPIVKTGDVLVVLDGTDVRFHGMIFEIGGNGWAVAADRTGSTIPVSFH